MILIGLFIPHDNIKYNILVGTSVYHMAKVLIGKQNQQLIKMQVISNM